MRHPAASRCGMSMGTSCPASTSMGTGELGWSAAVATNFVAMHDCHLDVYCLSQGCSKPGNCTGCQATGPLGAALALALK